MTEPATPAPQEPLLVVVLGPTGSGKSALALALAERFGGEIVNCDSVALYRDFEIGAAKPNREERARVPHHLFDVADPREQMTAGEYARQARQALLQIVARGKLPVVAGGTGLYLRALLQGLSPSPQRQEELRQKLRRRAKARGSVYLHRLLARLDLRAAEKIHPNDTPKLIRAIEVCLAGRQPMTHLWQQGREPLQGFGVLRLGLDPERQALYARINRRAQQMFASGLLEETARLLVQYGQSAWALSSLGYKQAGQILRGELSPELGVAKAQQGHRNYAKRQMTWFRREPDVRWLRGFGDDPAIQRQAEQLIESRLPAAVSGV
ncbi:MAG TPA: tRNA (adenosine(37)-N6)-dimethylallyltransferase MiaA [Terriglobales bacterium]|nr:tRNA (adenosine(37)-N6)-dimethylallyltransferase MiaA [Terriglobales bacterium]